MPPSKPSLTSYIDNELLRNGVRPEEATVEMRRAAQSGNFAALYGASPQTMERIIHERNELTPAQERAVRESFINQGTETRRWSAEIPQPQNMSRPTPFVDTDLRDIEGRVFAHMALAAGGDEMLMFTKDENGKVNGTVKIPQIKPVQVAPRPRRLLDLED